MIPLEIVEEAVEHLKERLTFWVLQEVCPLSSGKVTRMIIVLSG